MELLELVFEEKGIYFFWVLLKGLLMTDLRLGMEFEEIVEILGRNRNTIRTFLNNFHKI